jgi:hypothetical protein
MLSHSTPDLETVASTCLDLGSGNPRVKLKDFGVGAQSNMIRLAGASTMQQGSLHAAEGHEYPDRSTSSVTSNKPHKQKSGLENGTH